MFQSTWFSNPESSSLVQLRGDCLEKRPPSRRHLKDRKIVHVPNRRLRNPLLEQSRLDTSENPRPGRLHHPKPCLRDSHSRLALPLVLQLVDCEIVRKLGTGRDQLPQARERFERELQPFEPFRLLQRADVLRIGFPRSDGTLMNNSSTRPILRNTLVCTSGAAGRA